MAERVNGILKDEFSLGELPGEMKVIREKTKQSINIYNILRPHMSFEMITLVHMHAQDKIIIKT